MTEALGSADPTAVLGDQAAQRRQDHPDHRHLGGHLVGLLQVLGRGRRRERRSPAASTPTTWCVSRAARPTRPSPNGLLSQQGKVPGATGNFTTYLSAPGGVHLYDGINLAALGDDHGRRAPTRACTVPTSSRSVNGVPGATVCYSFAQCASCAQRQARRSGTWGRAARPASTASRLDRHLPDRHLHPERAGQDGRHHLARAAEGPDRMTHAPAVCARPGAGSPSGTPGRARRPGRGPARCGASDALPRLARVRPR